MLTAGDVVEMQEVVQAVRAAEPVKQYLVRLRAAQGWAAFSGRDFVVPEDIKEVALMVMSHRVQVDGGSGVLAKDVISELLDTVPVPL